VDATISEGANMPLIPCPDCQTEISDTAPSCIKCGRPMEEWERNAFKLQKEKLVEEEIVEESKATVNLEVSSNNISPSMFVGIISLLMIILGTLLPVVFVPIIGGIDYFGQGDRDGVIVFGLGIVSLLIFLSKRYRIVILLDMIIIAIVSYSLFVLMRLIKSTKEGLSETNLFGVDLSEVFVISIGPALLVILAGAVINLFISYKLSDT
jgi:hypothetical protein